VLKISLVRLSNKAVTLDLVPTSEKIENYCCGHCFVLR